MIAAQSTKPARVADRAFTPFVISTKPNSAARGSGGSAASAGMSDRSRSSTMKKITKALTLPTAANEPCTAAGSAAARSNGARCRETAFRRGRPRSRRSRTPVTSAAPT